VFIDVCITKWVPFGHSNVVPISQYTITHSLKFRGGIKVNQAIQKVLRYIIFSYDNVEQIQLEVQS